MYKLKVKRDECIACGACALECDILQEDSTGTVEVVGSGVVAGSEVSKIKNIVELCPTGALTLTEEFEDVGTKLAELKSKMQQPLTFNPLSADEYDFRMEDRDEYAEASGNYKYGVHQKLLKDLRAYVNELESYTGKKISLPSDFSPSARKTPNISMSGKIIPTIGWRAESKSTPQAGERILHLRPYRKNLRLRHGQPLVWRGHLREKIFLRLLHQARQRCEILS